MVGNGTFSLVSYTMPPTQFTENVLLKGRTIGCLWDGDRIRGPPVGYRCAMINDGSVEGGPVNAVPLQINFSVGNEEGRPNRETPGFGRYTVYIPSPVRQTPVFVGGTVPYRWQGFLDPGTLPGGDYSGTLIIWPIDDTVRFIFRVYIDRGSRDVRVVTRAEVKFGQNINYVATTPPALGVEISRASDDTIAVLAHMGSTNAENLGETFFRYNAQSWLKVPLFTTVVAGSGCTLIGKVYSFPDAVLDDVLTYGLLRYFLWFLMTGKWCIQICRRRYTKKFISVLLNSKFAEFFVHVFTSLRANEAYFKE